MSAPTVERAARPARPTRQPGSRTPRRSSGMPAAKDTTGAIGRAYARRAVREKKLAGEVGTSSGRSQFVLLIMVLLGVGLVASLWLSTTAAADSYRLDTARQATRDLSERSESLRTEIASMQSAPALAQAAQRMGMVQVSDVARLVVAPDGTVAVVGVPKAAVAPAPPAPPALPAPLAPGQAVPGRPGETVPGQPGQPGQPVAGQAGQQVAGDPGQPVAAVPGQPVQPAQQATGQGAAQALGQATDQAAVADPLAAPEQPGVPADQGPAQQVVPPPPATGAGH